MTTKQAKRIDWGEYLAPTAYAVQQLNIDAASFAICFGMSQWGDLLVVRDGHRTMEQYHPKFWKHIPEK